MATQRVMLALSVKAWKGGRGGGGEAALEARGATPFQLSEYGSQIHTQTFHVQQFCCF